jgi:hypothetical protein
LFLLAFDEAAEVAADLENARRELLVDRFVFEVEVLLHLSETVDARLCVVMAADRAAGMPDVDAVAAAVHVIEKNVEDLEVVPAEKLLQRP